MLGSVGGPEDVGVKPTEPARALRVQQQDVELQAPDPFAQCPAREIGQRMELNAGRQLDPPPLPGEDGNEMDLVATVGEPRAEPPEVALLAGRLSVGDADLDADPQGAIIRPGVPDRVTPTRRPGSRRQGFRLYAGSLYILNCL